MLRRVSRITRSNVGLAIARGHPQAGVSFPKHQDLETRTAGQGRLDGGESMSSRSLPRGRLGVNFNKCSVKT